MRDRFVAAQGGHGEGHRGRLDVRLEDGIPGFGVRSDDAFTRERRTLRARYQLVDGRTGQVLLDATAAQDAGIDVVGSEYATIAAETTSLERLAAGIADKIVARLAVYADRGGRSEEHTSELQSLMRISYAVFCLKKKKQTTTRG